MYSFVWISTGWKSSCQLWIKFIFVTSFIPLFNFACCSTARCSFNFPSTHNFPAFLNTPPTYQTVPMHTMPCLIKNLLVSISSSSRHRWASSVVKLLSHDVWCLFIASIKGWSASEMGGKEETRLIKFNWTRLFRSCFASIHIMIIMFIAFFGRFIRFW